MNDIKTKMWQSSYPTWHDRCTALFESPVPSTSAVAKWKDTWSNSEFQVKTDCSPSAVFRQCKQIGIHPYFWQYKICHHRVPTIIFYYGEDQIMYKMKFQ